MDHQNQVGFSWLWAPSGGGNGILFCNPEQQAFTTISTVSTSATTVDSNRVGKVLLENDNLPQHQQQSHAANTSGVVNVNPVSLEVLPISTKNSNQPQQNIPSLSTTNILCDPSPLSCDTPTMDARKSSNNADDETLNKSSNSKDITSQLKMKAADKVLVDEEELARKREMNRLRERRRRELMTPKERAKARKKNRLRARKRRRNMSQEEREQEKERNRERARQRRLQKLRQE